MSHILVIEDHPLFRSALVHLIRSTLDAEIHLAGCGKEGLEILSREPGISLVIMDLGLPGDLSGRAAVAAVHAARPELPILVVSGTEDSDSIEAVTAAGASAYVAKTTAAEELGAVLRRLAVGIRWRGAPKQLTERQREILRLLCEGLSNKEIGRKLDLSDATVKMHMTAVLRALGVASRTQAVLAARSLGLDVA